MHWARALVLFAALIAVAACRTPATQALVTIGTDIPASVRLTITASVLYESATGGSFRSWIRASPESGETDGGINLPASFAVVPASGEPRDAPVRVIIEARADTVVIRRLVTFRFVPNATVSLPIFLTVRCAAPSTGCTASPCTVQQLCEEQMQTCGNEGICTAVTPPVVTDAGTGAPFPDVRPPACGAYHEACCLLGAACHTELSCVGGRCQRCTDPGEACCAGGQLRPNSVACGPAVDLCHVSGTCLDGVCGAVTNAPNGTVCRPSTDACRRDSVCLDGVCATPAAVSDGTNCGTAPDACHRDPVCAAGVCAPPPNVAEGTVCASTMDTCRRDGTCRSGVCSGLVDAPNGMVCSSTINPCLRSGVCNAGVCGALANAPDGTVCAMASDPCHRDGTCSAGTCSGVTNAPDGTMCGAAPDLCHRAPACLAGACAPAANAADGTVCAPRVGPCQNDGTCTAGVCGARTSRPDGSPGTGARRCCGGNDVDVNTLTNCGACGIACTGLQRCVQLRGEPQYYCSPCSGHSTCWSGCCSIAYGTPYACAASDCSGMCIPCPGNATCTNTPGMPTGVNPNFCSY